MRVGNSLFAEVAVGGKLLESSVQGFMEQQWNYWPLSAKYVPLFVCYKKSDFFTVYDMFYKFLRWSDILSQPSMV